VAAWKHSNERSEKLESEVARLESINIAQSTIIAGAKEEMDKLKAEVAELNRLLAGWKQRATMSETTLEATQKDLRRTVEIAEDVCDELLNPDDLGRRSVQGISRAQLNAIKATLPETK
jgi:archaellum component FlaC